MMVHQASLTDCSRTPDADAPSANHSQPKPPHDTLHDISTRTESVVVSIGIKTKHTLSSTLSAFFHIHSSSSSLNSDLNTSLQIGHVTCFASSPGGTTTNRARSSASRLALSAVAMALTFDKRDEGPASLSPLLNGKSRIQSYTKQSYS
jgi:hypothetical protein